MESDVSGIAPIKGDYQEHDDTTITVEAYDNGLTLLTVEVAGQSFPVEVTNVTALELARRLTQTVEGATLPPLFGEPPEDKELFAEVYAAAGHCDTCWYLCSDQREIPRDEVIKKVRAHLASGHTTTTEDEDTEGK